MPKSAEITDVRLQRLLFMLGGLRPIELEVNIPDERYLLGKCWFNAYAQAKQGGSVIHGWLFWDDNRGIVAQHHSVWKRPDNKLVDVTPNRDDNRFTTFAPSIEHQFDYGWLKTWINLRICGPTDLTFEYLDKDGLVLTNIYPVPTRARLIVQTKRELLEIRQLCPEAGNKIESWDFED